MSQSLELNVVRTIYSHGPFRIVETFDLSPSLEDLEGDIFKPECNPDKTEEQLIREREAFHDLINEVGTFGYSLEKWNPEIGAGWEHVDSCWGFVGRYEPDNDLFNHYIVDELKRRIHVETGD